MYCNLIIVSKFIILGAFTKQLMTASLSICPSFRPHGKMQLQYDELSWNFILEFLLQFVKMLQFSLKGDRSNINFT
jgi:hypothetical protein